MGLFCYFRYIIDSRIEEQVTLDRLTSIPMPHRGATPTLRPRSSDEPSKDVLQTDQSTSGKNMSSIEWLKAGLKTNSKGELVMSRRMRMRAKYRAAYSTLSDDEKVLYEKWQGTITNGKVT
jgi:hypothetical protein